MVSFENFVKSMAPSLLELKVTASFPSLLELKVIASFCFPFKIPDNPNATNIFIQTQTFSTFRYSNLHTLKKIFPEKNKHIFRGLYNVPLIYILCNCDE